MIGCSKSADDRLEVPQALIAPYDTSKGDAVWAVVPLSNESGVSDVDTFMLADKVAAAVNEARGLTCLPLNRTISAMRSLGLSAVRTPQDAMALTRAIGCDGLIIGSVTAYDPYDPPKLGLALALFTPPRAPEPGIDPAHLSRAYTDGQVRVNSTFSTKPAAVASEHLDGSNHETLAELKRFAQGRSDTSSALGWRCTLASMERFSEFAAYTLVSRLIDQERIAGAQPVMTNAEDGGQMGEPPGR